MKILRAIALSLLILPVHAQADEDIATLNDAIAKRFPNVKVSSIDESVIPGLYQVVAGTQVVYMDTNGRYMLDGSIVDLDSQENLTENAKSGVRLDTLGKLDEDEMLIYSPESPKHTITVVTDIDCPYCRKLHGLMDDFLDNDIRVRYIFMPFKGQRSYSSSVSVWCSDDPQLALDIAKAGGDVERATCDNPIRKHQKIARELQVKGTPAIVLEDGRLIPGYVDVQELLKYIGKGGA